MKLPLSSPQTPPLAESLVAGLVLALFWICMLASLKDKSLTSDEPQHAAVGYTYWKFNDYTMHPGNLAERWCALPLVVGSYRFPPGDWKRFLEGRLDGYHLGYNWIYKSGNNSGSMLFRGRAASGLLAVILGALVWLWARRLFGPAGGLLSLLLYVLNPTVLGNGALMTADIACSLFFLAATGCVWAMLHRLSPLRVLVSGLVMGGLFVVKASAPLIIPIGLTLIMARLLIRRPLPVAFGPQRELTRPGPQALALAAAVLAHLAITLVVIWGFYGFRYSTSPPAPPGSDRPTSYVPWATVLDKSSPDALLDRLSLDFTHEVAARRIFQSLGVPMDQWSPRTSDALQAVERTVLSPAQARRLEALAAAPPATLMSRTLDFINRRHWLPEAFIFHYAFEWKLSQERPSFFNGEFNFYGRKTFFPYTFLVKTPLPVFAIIALAATAAGARWRREGKSWGAPVWRQAGRGFYETLPLWILLTFYWGVAIFHHVNVGHRHILPTYAPLFVLCGAAVGWMDGSGRGTGIRVSRMAGVAICGLMVALAAEMAWRFPNYLAYFNGIVSPDQGYRHLVDNSLDWGQDLPGVKRYLQEHPPAGRVFLSYFGVASPGDYQIPITSLYSAPGWDWQASPPVLELDQPAPPQGRLRSYEFLGSTVHPDGMQGWLWAQKPSELRLSGGTYFISATLLQPLTPIRPWGRWTGRYEATYQDLYRTVRPFLQDDSDRRAALEQQPITEWQRLLSDFEEYRFARLAAFLRQREPDANVNFSILIYHLTDADVARALDGPPVESDAMAEVRRYEEGLRFEPDTADAFSNLGAALAEAGRIPEAISCFQNALSITPDDAKAHYDLGNTLAQIGRIPEAIVQYEEAVRIKPDYAKAQTNLGIALAQTGQAIEALSHFEEVLQLNPDSDDAHNNLGGVLFSLGRLPEAIGQFEQALQINPYDAKARNNLTRLRVLQQTHHSGG
jgi:tetratricopeptide (TPR) repeat protein